MTCVLDNNGFDDCQYAYLKNRSSTHAVLVLTESIKRNLNGKVTGVVFFDYTDAFGTVNRSKLLMKLCEDFGVSGRLLLFLIDFLSSRYARNKVNELIGDWISSDSGTSAGTILGVMLFISYVHETPRCIRPKFADNLVSHVSGSNILSVQTELQHNLNELIEWSKKWNMTLNIGKTKAMLFGGKPGDTVILNAGGSSIENVSEYKYLGVILDDHLRFDVQSEYVATKARRAFAKVNRLFDGRKGIPVKISPVGD